MPDYVFDCLIQDMLDDIYALCCWGPKTDSNMDRGCHSQLGIKRSLSVPFLDQELYLSRNCALKVFSLPPTPGVVSSASFHAVLRQHYQASHPLKACIFLLQAILLRDIRIFTWTRCGMNLTSPVTFKIAIN